MGIKCCKDCKDRVLGCHSTCKKYIKEKELLNKYNAKLKEERRNMQPYPKSYR